MKVAIVCDWLTGYGGAEAFIVPGLDDFGITAVEALAAGTPVVAYKDGGVLDYLKEGKNGLFFEPQSVAELAKTLEGFPRHKFDAKTVQATARGFTSVNFTRKVRRFIDQKIG
jgi:glycosyltransferase involved in cell wall biosynthesis